MKTNKYILIQFLFITTLLSAQVDIEISDDMLLETTGDLVIKVSGDVVESGNGYLNGVVTSGVRGAIAQFAGLTLSSPLNGKITRTTGKMYPGTGENLTRYYEVDSQEDSDLIVNVTTVSTTAEHGSLTGPFFHYTRNGSNWKGCGYGSLGTTIVSNDVLFPQNSITNLIISEGVSVKVKIFLEGPYNTVYHNMNNYINNIIPLTSPYSADVRTASNKPSTSVDWGLVQLRDQTSPSTVVASRSAFLNSDGNLIDDNATSGISIAAPAGDYYIAIKHRNHLAVMSANKVTLPNTTSYDFTTSDTSYFGSNGAKLLETNPSNVWGMIAGDANADGTVKYNGARNDRFPILTRLGNVQSATLNGYFVEDVNMNGQVKYNGPNNDRVIILNNLDNIQSSTKDTQVPN